MSLLLIILICVVSVLGVIDIRRKSVSVFALLALLVFSVAWNLVSGELGVTGMLLGALPAGILFLIVKFGKLNIGLGDVLLIAVLGVALGADTVSVTLLIASIACAALSGILLLTKRVERGHTVPFIPFIGGGLAASGVLQITGIA